MKYTPAIEKVGLLLITVIKCTCDVRHLSKRILENTEFGLMLGVFDGDSRKWGLAVDWKLRGSRHKSVIECLFTYYPKGRNYKLQLKL